MTNIIAALLLGASIITAAVLSNWDEVRPLNRSESLAVASLAGPCTKQHAQFIATNTLRGRLQDAVADYCGERQQ